MQPITCVGTHSHTDTDTHALILPLALAIQDSGQARAHVGTAAPHASAGLSKAGAGRIVVLCIPHSGGHHATQTWVAMHSDSCQVTAGQSRQVATKVVVCQVQLSKVLSHIAAGAGDGGVRYSAVRYMILLQRHWWQCSGRGVILATYATPNP